MKIEIPDELASFTAEYLRKRVARQKKMMPDPNYRDPWIEMDAEGEAKAKEYALEAVRKAKNFIKNAEAIIAIMENK